MIENNWLSHEVVDSLTPDCQFHNAKWNYKSWKRRLGAMASENRKTFLLEAIEDIKTGPKLPLKVLTVCLRGFQDLALSPKVSDLKKCNFYAKKKVSYYHRTATIFALQQFFTEKYPDENIHYVSKLDQFPVEELLASEGPAWIVLQYGKYLHFSLMRFLKTEDTNILQIFDSIGMLTLEGKSGRTPCYHWITSIIEKLQDDDKPLQVDSIKEERQWDNVSCSAFVVSDFRKAQLLLGIKELLFENGEPNTGLFMDSQRKEHIEEGLSNPDFLTVYRSEDKEPVNSEVTFVALKLFEYMMSNHVSYPNAKQSCCFG